MRLNLIMLAYNPSNPVTLTNYAAVVRFRRGRKFIVLVVGGRAAS